MFYIFNFKKMLRYSLAVLLFVAITAIIITGRQTGSGGAMPVSAEGERGRVLIIDPGHGGLDGGAVGVDGTIESALNLQISQKLCQIARFLGCETVMTRTSEELDYPPELSTISKKKVWDQASRVELINSYDNACLISIHQNKYPDSRPSGAQVLYAATPGSDELGKLAHNNLVEQLCPENRRVPAQISDKVYLMRNVKCTAILAECGFVSNAAELDKLKSGDYQKKLALTLAASYLQFTDELGGTYEGEKQVLLH